jgi:hypothetical protein
MTGLCGVSQDPTFSLVQRMGIPVLYGFHKVICNAFAREKEANMHHNARYWRPQGHQS